MGRERRSGRADVDARGEPARSWTPDLVVLGSTNPAKQRAVELALVRLFPGGAPPLRCRAVASGVPHQPRGERQTRDGARQRALSALALAGPRPAVGIGIEGGVWEVDGELWAGTWVEVAGSEGRRGAARSAAFALPDELRRLLDAGLELGAAVDRAFGLDGSKLAGGAVGALTGGALERPELYAHAVLLALRSTFHGEPPSR